MADLFISYSREDQEIARRFAEGFERAGLSVWWDQSLNPGEAFDQVTEQALEQARAVIVLWSKTSVSSRWVRAEATQANADGRLVPVMVEACKRPIMFELTHTADLSHWKGNRDDPAWQAFLASVQRFVQRGGQGHGAAVQPVPATRPTLRQRAASVWDAVLALTTRTGSLLRRFGLRLAFGTACAAVAAYVTWQMRPRIEHEVTRFSIPLPVANGSPVPLALSPDGRRVVYNYRGQLFSRRLDQDEPTRIPGVDDAVNMPFFSPDGSSLAFFTDGPSGMKLKAFDFKGEATRVLADVKTMPGRSGDWDEEGRIIFGKVGPEGLSQVAAVGGVPEQVAAPGDYNMLSEAQVMPGGRWILYTGFAAGMGTYSTADIVAQNLVSGERRVVLKGGYRARFVPTGHLLFMRNGTLFAVAFDPGTLAAHGREVPVVQGVLSDEGNGYALYAVADNGTLVFYPGAAANQSGSNRNVVRADRNGALTVLSKELRNYTSPRALPDGSKIAVEVTGEDGSVHIWVMDAKTGAATQLTFDGDEDRYPLWTADSKDVIYVSRRGQDHALWRKAANGTGTAQHILDGTEALAATDVHGDTLIYQESGAGGDQRDLFTLDLESGGPGRALLTTPDDEVGGRVSPDGRWIAYVLTPRVGGTADRRVYVRPYPDAAAGGQRAVSDGQGAGVEWSPSGDEILYSINGANSTPLMAVPITATASTITPGAPRVLFTLADRFQFTQTGSRFRFGYTYEVLPGTNQILGVAMESATAPLPGDDPGTDAARFNVVLNWFEELKRLVPVD